MRTYRTWRPVEVNAAPAHIRSHELSSAVVERGIVLADKLHDAPERTGGGNESWQNYQQKSQRELAPS
jgi:hypothetical protein